jgi:ABC-2 type transport system ATP-binding protein
MIQINNLTKRFGQNIALDDVSFEVTPGTVFALLGENGAGKTTAIKIMLGLLEPDAGQATVLGFDARKEDLKIRQNVGYVPEQPALYEWMSVEEIGRFIAAFYLESFWPEYKRLAEFYQLPLVTKIQSLSKGQRAKVSLCLALAHDPQLLILDEPTSGLDAMVRREFLESMVDRAATGKTVFLSSHQIAEVERVADTIAILKKSKLVLVEPLEQLKSTTRLLAVTFTDEVPNDYPFPFDTIVQKQTDNRQIRILGRNLKDGAMETLKNDPIITQAEVEQPTLEEIFVAYMSK